MMCVSSLLQHKFDERTPGFEKFVHFGLTSVHVESRGKWSHSVLNRRRSFMHLKAIIRSS